MQLLKQQHNTEIWAYDKHINRGAKQGGGGFGVLQPP